jgi:predicted nucleic acid-binding protein
LISENPDPLRPPSRIIVVDTNIVLGAALGIRSTDVFERIGQSRVLVISEHAAREVVLVAKGLTENGHSTASIAPLYLDTLSIISGAEYGSLMQSAMTYLQRAPASRNGSTTDAHVLALAWTLDADIWSHDRDFAGTGWPSWSSANLAAALSEEATASDARPI